MGYLVNVFQAIALWALVFAPCLAIVVVAFAHSGEGAIDRSARQ